MTVVVQGANVLEAWQHGSQLILKTPGHIIRNLTTEVENPIFLDATWYRRFDPKAIGAADRMSVVAKVLFPGLVRLQGETRSAYYDRSAALLTRALRQGRLHSSWGGTYFHLLLSLAGSENQIERAIRVLTNWQVRSETAIVAHTSSPAVDGLRKRGSPCLQFIEILWSNGGHIDLVAVYRNHDFLNKTLGNFVGLGRLLAFIAAEGGKVPGRLICHSVRAYTDEVGKLQALTTR
jgi:thymidylate synthase